MTSCEERADRLALVNAGLASSSDLIGCSDTEIAHVEENAGKRLPGSYLVFLRKFGKSAGRLMADVDVFYDSMIGLTDVAKEFVDSCERGTLCLPENAYVFAMGHSAAWIVFFTLDSVQAVRLVNRPARLRNGMDEGRKRVETSKVNAQIAKGN